MNTSQLVAQIKQEILDKVELYNITHNSTLLNETQKEIDDLINELYRLGIKTEIDWDTSFYRDILTMKFTEK